MDLFIDYYSLDLCWYIFCFVEGRKVAFANNCCIALLLDSLRVESASSSSSFTGRTNLKGFCDCRCSHWAANASPLILKHPALPKAIVARRHTVIGESSSSLRCFVVVAVLKPSAAAEKYSLSLCCACASLFVTLAVVFTLPVCQHNFHVQKL